MTRKDFVLIAKVLADARADGYLDNDVANRLARDFAWVLAGTNPNFDRGKFITDVTGY